MNLGFDLDEVIAKTSTMMIDHVNHKFECSLTTDVFKKYKISENIYANDDELNKEVIEAIEWAIRDKVMMSNIKPYELAVKTLHIFRKMGHKIHIITRRYKSLEETTMYWLFRNNIPFDSLDVIGLDGDKGIYAKKYMLDCFVDDLYTNLSDMKAQKHRWKKGLMLMTRPWNKDLNMDGNKYMRINDWNDILKHIQLWNRLK